jgi:hypothetical protein
MKNYRLPILLLVAWALAYGVFRVGGVWAHGLLVMAGVALVWRVMTLRREAVRTP